jgi:hypothetical protein
MKKLFNIYNWLSHKNIKIELDEEEGNLLKTLEEDYNIIFDNGYIEIFEPDGIHFTNDIRLKLVKLGYKNAFDLISGTEYYYKYSDK